MPLPIQVLTIQIDGEGGPPHNPPARKNRSDGPIRVAAYLRVSHELQADNFTFETQESRIREKLDNYYGPGSYEVTIYQDDGLSGGYGPEATGIQRRTRPTLKRLGQEIQDGHYDCLAVYHSSRLFRSIRWFFQWYEDVISPSDIDLLSATENFDFRSSQGRATIGIAAVMNASYREDCQQRVRDAMVTRSEQGYTLGSIPYGWLHAPHTSERLRQRRGIIPNPETGPHLLFIKDRYLAGAGGPKIAAELNERGVPTPRDAKWSEDQVLRILKNPVHAGFVPTKRHGLIQGQHFEQRYWEPETYREILDLCARRRTYWKTQTAKPNSPHLINGIAFCARCGKRLYTTSSGYRSYVCRNGRHQGKATCPNVTVRAEILEIAVIEETQRAAQDPLMCQLLLQEAGRVTSQQDQALYNERDLLNQTMENLKEQSTRLLDCLGRGVIAEAEFAAANSQLHFNRNEVQARLKAIETSLSNRVDREAWAMRLQKAVLDFPQLWEHATFDEQRQLLLTLVESLTVDRHEGMAVVRIKIYLLPERELRVSFDTMQYLKVKPKGIEALTSRQMAVLHYVGQNKTPKEIAEVLNTGICNIYHFTMDIRRVLGVRDMKDAFEMARSHIETQLPFLPLGATGRSTLRSGKPPVLHETLLEVLPLLSQGATGREISQRTGLTIGSVMTRRKRILEVFGAKTIFEAAQRAKALGMLPP